MSELAATLQQEHLTIRDSLDLVGALVEALDRGDALPAEDLNSVLDVMENYTDKSHRAKEEAIFAQLVMASDRSVRPLIHQLEIEHGATRKIVAALRALVPQVTAGDPKARRDFEMYLRSYRLRTRDHIREETRQLIPLIEALSRVPGQDAAIPGLADIKRQDQEGRSLGRYRELIRALTAKYASRIRTHA